MQLICSSSDGTNCKQLDNELRAEKNITVKPTFGFPSILCWCLPRFISCILRLIWDSICLLISLPLISGPDFIVLQNPPALPALPLCYLYTVFHPSTKLVLDWHNYDHIVLGLSLGSYHPIVLLTRLVENFVGARVNNSFCVSKAMKKDLEERLGVCATVLYDRPSNDFRLAINMSQGIEEKSVFPRQFGKLQTFPKIPSSMKIFETNTFQRIADYVVSQGFSN